METSQIEALIAEHCGDEHAERDLHELLLVVADRNGREPDDAELHKVQAEASAPYLAEMVRREMIERYGKAVYTSGYEVITTLDVRLQKAANEALRKGLITYSKRHGYRGPEANLVLDEVDEEEWSDLLDDYRTVGGLIAGLVTRVDEKSVEVLLEEGDSLRTTLGSSIDLEHRHPRLDLGPAVEVTLLLQRLGERLPRLGKVAHHVGGKAEVGLHHRMIRQAAGGLAQHVESG